MAWRAGSIVQGPACMVRRGLGAQANSTARRAQQSWRAGGTSPTTWRRLLMLPGAPRPGTSSGALSSSSVAPLPEPQPLTFLLPEPW